MGRPCNRRGARASRVAAGEGAGPSRNPHTPHTLRPSRPHARASSAPQPTSPPPLARPPSLTLRPDRPIVPRPFSAPRAAPDHPVRKTIAIADFVVGGDTFAVMEGPCAVESEAQLMASAEAVAQAGARVGRLDEAESAARRAVRG